MDTCIKNYQWLEPIYNRVVLRYMKILAAYIFVFFSYTAFSQDIWYEKNFKLITDTDYRKSLRGKTKLDTLITETKVILKHYLGPPACAYAISLDGGLPKKELILGDSVIILSEIEPNLGCENYFHWPDDLPNGDYAVLFENTKIPYLKFRYEDGEYHGTYYEFNSSGTIYIQKKYSYGKLNGPGITFYPNGVPKKIEHFENGKRQGPSAEYYRSGQLKSLNFFSGGKRNGVSREYSTNGRLTKSCKYKDGLKDSVEFVYEEGKFTHQTYAEGELNGPSWFLNQDSILTKRDEFKNNMLNGNRTFYYPNGVEKEIRSYKDNILDGPWIVKDSTGSEIMNSNYSNGRENGSRKYYSDGVLVAQSIYSNGEVLTTKVYKRSIKRQLKRIRPLFTESLKLSLQSLP